MFKKIKHFLSRIQFSLCCFSSIAVRALWLNIPLNAELKSLQDGALGFALTSREAFFQRGQSLCDTLYGITSKLCIQTRHLVDVSKHLLDVKKTATRSEPTHLVEVLSTRCFIE